MSTVTPNPARRRNSPSQGAEPESEHGAGRRPPRAANAAGLEEDMRGLRLQHDLGQVEPGAQHAVGAADGAGGNGDIMMRDAGAPRHQAQAAAPHHAPPAVHVPMGPLVQAPPIVGGAAAAAAAAGNPAWAAAPAPPNVAPSNVDTPAVATPQRVRPRYWPTAVNVISEDSEEGEGDEEDGDEGDGDEGHS